MTPRQETVGLFSKEKIKEKQERKKIEKKQVTRSKRKPVIR